MNRIPLLRARHLAEAWRRVALLALGCWAASLVVMALWWMQP